MNELKIFSHSEFGEIGVITIDGREHFPAIACAKVLGYSNPRKAIIDHCKGVTKRDVPTNGGSQEMKFIPEADLYRLIFRSKLPAAEKFECWVVEDILPTIRKQGYYSTRDELPLDRVTEIIQQTATVVVSEVLRQLIPAIIPSAQAQPVQGQPTFTFTMNSPPLQSDKLKRTRKRTPGKIEKLNSELRRKVDNMLFHENISMEKISDYLKSQGHDISYGAVGRYYQYRINR